MKDPTNLAQFRPISLCNVLYKTASQVLSNRLKLILPEIILEEQSAFVPGHLITNNIITTCECLHFMKRNKAQRNRYCAVKLDMMKAYDRVEWNYLESIMTKMGFPPSWVASVMRMVTSVKFSVMFNGGKLEKFSPTRGIHQGDPISPYLFLLAEEGLSCLLKTQDESSHLAEIQFAPTAPPVSHLLFADDSLMFVKASTNGANELSALMETYCNASGQRINLSKSSVFFSTGCLSVLKTEVKNALNIANESLFDRYLGMPSDVGNYKNGAFNFRKDRVWSKVKGWMEKLLSVRGKEVLIKSVTQAIPVYSMSYFRLPCGLSKHINTLIRKFWWGSKEGKQKPSWVCWSMMTQPKYCGGLGFRDIELFNIALLARQAWRILTDPESLSARILKAKYYPTGEFLQVELCSAPSQIWRSILDGRDVLTEGLIRRIGNGLSTSIWNHNWLPRPSNMRPIVSRVLNPPLMVSELILPSAEWN